MVELRDLVLGNGLRCIGDAESELYTELTNKSQAATPWAYQKQYGKFVTYLIVVIIFLCFVKKLVTKYYDSSEEFLPNKNNSVVTLPLFLALNWEKACRTQQVCLLQEIPNVRFF